MTNEPQKLSKISIAKIFYSFFIGAFAALILAGISFFAAIIIGDSVIGHSFKIGTGGWWTTILSFTKSDNGFSAGIGGGSIVFILGVGLLNSAIAAFFQMRKNKVPEENQSKLI